LHCSIFVLFEFQQLAGHPYRNAKFPPRQAAKIQEFKVLDQSARADAGPSANRTKLTKNNPDG
jgi:hypothetical protein